MKLSLGGCALVVGILLTTAPFDGSAKERADISLVEIQKILGQKKFIDLTHAFAPGIPHWSGFPRSESPGLQGPRLLARYV